MPDNRDSEDLTVQTDQDSDVIVNEPDQVAQKYAGLSESDREKLISEMKGFNADYTRKTMELARTRKELEAREVEIKKVAENLAKVGQSNVPQVKAEAEDSFDSLIQNAATPQDREALRKFRDVIRRETNVSDLKKEIEELKSLLKVQSDSYQGDRVEQLHKQIDGLKDKYGADLVEKHRDQIVQNGVQNRISARKLLHYFADEDALEQALRVQVKKKENGEQQTQKPKVTSTAARPDSDRFKDLKKPGDGHRAVRGAVAEVTKKLLGH